MAIDSYVVGQELAFRCGSHSQWWEIAKIERITPSGRMYCGRFEVNPDLSIRGRGGYSGPYVAEPVTDEIRDEIRRAKNLSFVKSTKWDYLSDTQLAEIVRLIKASKLQGANDEFGKA